MAEGRRGRKRVPVRRLQSLHPTALLVDQHENVGASRVARRVGEPADLIGVLHVAGEQDHTARPRLAQDSCFGRRKLRPRQRGYECCYHGGQRISRN